MPPQGPPRLAIVRQAMAPSRPLSDQTTPADAARDEDSLFPGLNLPPASRPRSQPGCRRTGPEYTAERSTRARDSVRQPPDGRLAVREGGPNADDPRLRTVLGRFGKLGSAWRVHSHPVGATLLPIRHHSPAGRDTRIRYFAFQADDGSIPRNIGRRPGDVRHCGTGVHAKGRERNLPTSRDAAIAPAA
jgi:hypothetical protein